MIVLYTAIIGAIDPLWSCSTASPTTARRVCLTDCLRQEVGNWRNRHPIDRAPVRPKARWEQRVIAPTLPPRRQARFFKTQPHLLFPDAAVWIWVDGNVRLRGTPEDLVARYLPDGVDFVTLRHPDRDCLYTEAAFCAQHGYDARATLEAQAATYRAAGMPEHWGLAETRVVIRRNTPEMCALNAAWWAEIAAHSRRDQIALPFVCWQAGLRWAEIPGRIQGDRHPDFWHDGAVHIKQERARARR